MPKLNNVGLVLEKDEFKVIKKSVEAGGSIVRHNHPGHHILFTVVKGKVELKYNDDEVNNLMPGDIFYFDGANYIEANIIDDSEIFVTLIKKQ